MSRSREPRFRARDRAHPPIAARGVLVLPSRDRGTAAQSPPLSSADARCVQVGSDIIISIAGNKLDLERQRVVTRQQAQEYAESAGAHYSETSAKQGRGIDEVFGNMGRRLLAAKPAGAVAASGRTRQPSKITISDDPEPKKSSGGCC